MKIKLTLANFSHDAFAREAREIKSWADMEDEMKNRVKPKPSSFKTVGPRGKFILIKWNTGEKEYCTDAQHKKYQKRYSITN